MKSKTTTDEDVYALLDQGEQNARDRPKGANSEAQPDEKGLKAVDDQTAGRFERQKGQDASRGSYNGSRSDRNRYSEEREENDERRSRRSKTLAEDSEMKDGSDDDRANDNDWDRHAKGGARTDSYVPGRHAHRNGHRRDDRHAEPQRPSTRVGYGNRSDSRSRDRDRPPTRAGHDVRRSSSRDREHDRHRSRSPRRDDRAGRDGDRRAREARARTPPPPSTNERDSKTVFVLQLANRTRGRELKEFFEAAGCPVYEAQIVRDRNSHRSKGVGYVEFENESSIEEALKLTGRQLNGVPIIVQLAEAEKNREKKKTESGGSGAHPPRLYVGNINFNITEEELASVFAPFQTLQFAKIGRDETGRSRGYGFVQYSDATSARNALEALNGFELGGRSLRVGLGSSERMNVEDTPSQQDAQGSSFSGMGGRGSHAGGSTNFDRAGGRHAHQSGGASALDDSDVNGFGHLNFNREELMAKLARKEDSQPTVQAKTQATRPADAETAPTRCILIKNMFNQAKEMQKDPSNAWQAELKEDVKSECNSKYGVVKHLDLTLDNDEGEVYVKFDRIEGGKNAVRGLNGRFFGGNRIMAQYVVEAVYNMIFPTAANV